MSLKGKSAIVTGSTSGIGLAIAQRLAADGANLMLNGFGDAKEIENLRKGIEGQHQVTCAYSGADMSKPAEIAKMVRAAEAALGSVDILVNNAGVQHVDKVENFPDEKWDFVIAVNLSAAFHATKAAVPGMKKRGWGRVINIASAHGVVASDSKAAYVASKHGIIGLTKVVALDHANDGITCNAICPGWVLTPLVQKQIEARAKASGRSVREEEEALLKEKQPMVKFTLPEDLAALASFLCSDNAKTITGASYLMDGGWTAQ
jgi:3-hydroxybutyrate dehydrogenase